MKEATSELNLTLFVVIAVGIMLAFFYSSVWPSMKRTLGSTAECQRAVDCKKNAGGKDATCVVFDLDDDLKIVQNSKRDVTCSWKG